MVERAFTGFAALPAPKSPWEVIGVKHGASLDQIEAAYKAKAKKLHSEYGSGADVMMAELNAARAKLKDQAA
jgi:curved DNA-binding protein CbpA